MPHHNVIVTTPNVLDDIKTAVEKLDEKHDYGGTDEELYKTDGYSGEDADIDGTERYTSDIDLTSQTAAVVDFKHDSSGTTDDIWLYLYKRRDSSWDGDEVAIARILVESDGSEDIYQHTITEAYGPGHYRYGMKRTGSTDTFEIDVEMRRSNLADSA